METTEAQGSQEMVAESGAAIGDQSTSSGMGRGKRPASAAKPSRGGRGGRGSRKSMEEAQGTAATPQTTRTGERSVDDGVLRRSRRLNMSSQTSSRNESGRLEQEGGHGSKALDTSGESSESGEEASNEAECNPESGNPNVPTTMTTAVEELSDEEEEPELPDSIPAAEEQMRKEYRRDSFACVNLMRRTPIEKFSKLKIPLCRMVGMPEVRVTLEREVERLMREFQFGYRPGSACFYVAISSSDGRRLSVNPEIEETWNDEWKAENKKFEAILNQDSDLKQVSGLMFFVWDGNHRLEAWKQVIAAQHENLGKWYGESGNPDCMVLDIPPHGVSQIQTAMHDINS
jgi:hypothetical protein